ncbi:hypothetical protein ELUMI_v1c07810 [Williamsoniiplasma luminosum]|uniref:Uncharacterized protein n=1 Tax=Williamsoniiplasma luminosum TaxID=214888 RepID=A0A2K8NXY3_9MOLU|nr:hypothetical protein [Williamsoniiplasma luminosum]ATZ17503.1 hypothetical protein ELUMI_v1c07810 [Williamsoniiplasma luminosum]
MRKTMKIFFWTFFGISIAALLVGIGIKWLNIQTSPIVDEGWKISEMFSPFKEKNWSLNVGFNYEWIQQGSDYWQVKDIHWYNGTALSPTNLVFDMVANYAILIVSTVAMGIALLSLIFFIFSKKQGINPNQVQVIVNTLPNAAPTQDANVQENTQPQIKIEKPAPVEVKPVKAVIAEPIPVAPVAPVEPKKVDENNSQDYLAKLEAKYAEALKKQEEAEKLERKKYEDALKNAAQEEERQKIIKLLADSVAKKQQMSTQERAKLDGSDAIAEPRSELQKHANKMRSLIDEKHKLFSVNLRDMTKKELIKYMRQVANII